MKLEDLKSWQKVMLQAELGMILELASNNRMSSEMALEKVFTLAAIIESTEVGA
jgi:hypothetical protein